MNKRQFTKTFLGSIGGIFALPITISAKQEKISHVKKFGLLHHQKRIIDEIKRTKFGQRKALYVPRNYGTSYSIAHYAKENPNVLIVASNYRQAKLLNKMGAGVVVSGQSEERLLTLVKEYKFDTVIFDGACSNFPKGRFYTFPNKETQNIKIIYIDSINDFIYMFENGQTHEDLFLSLITNEDNDSDECFAYTSFTKQHIVNKMQELSNRYSYILMETSKAEQIIFS